MVPHRRLSTTLSAHTLSHTLPHTPPYIFPHPQADKDREYYLGHSVKALAGRWQKGVCVGGISAAQRQSQGHRHVACTRHLPSPLPSPLPSRLPHRSPTHPPPPPGRDVYWYTRDKGGGANALQDEIAAVKQREEELMLEVRSGGGWVGRLGAWAWGLNEGGGKWGDCLRSPI